MADDWYVQIGYKRMAELNAGRAQALADLEYAKSNGDNESASAALQNIADIDAASKNSGALYDQYTRSQQPPPQPSKEQRAARQWQEMDWQDAWDVAAKSKHGVDPDAFRAGQAEVMRRRARGE